MIELPNNRLILNGHRIANLKQFYEYLSKKFKTTIKKPEDLRILNEYKDLNIAIRHAWSFLEEESKTKTWNNNKGTIKILKNKTDLISLI